MKYILTLSLLVFISCQKEEVAKANPAKSSNIAKESALPSEIAEEPCDDPEEVMKEKLEKEEFTLSGGDTGCSLDELK